MRGKDDRSEILFSYIRLDERIPADHPLRVIRQLVDAALAELSRAFTKLYARDGRPSIPPERLLRGLLLQAFYTVPEQYHWAIEARTVASCGRCRLLDTRSHDDHWTKCLHPETAHNTVSSYDCTVDDLELVFKT